MKPPAILILCTGNSCRSHLAEAILRKALGEGFRVESAGSKPAGYVHPLAIRALEEEQFAVFRRVRDEILKVFTAYAAGRLDASQESS